MDTQQLADLAKDPVLCSIVERLEPATAELVTPLAISLQAGEPDSEIRFAPLRPEDLRDFLTGEFDPDVLELSGFLTPVDGRLELVEGLRTPGAPVILARTRPENECFFVAADGGGYAPFPAFLLDFWTRSHLETWSGALIATETVREMAAWRQLGLPAAALGGLKYTPPAQQRHVADSFGKLTRVQTGEVQNELGSDAAPREPGPDALDAVLIIPGWDPVTGLPGASADVRRRVQTLQQIERTAPCDFAGVGVWTPPEPTLARVRRSLLAGNLATAQRTLRASLAADVTLADAFDRAAAEQQPGDFVAARRALAATIAGVEAGLQSEEDLRRAQSAFRKRGEEELVTPLLQAAQTAADPLQKALHHAAADVVRRGQELDAEELTARPSDLQGKRRADERRRLLHGDLLRIIQAIDRGNGGRRRHAR